jgi:putative nucleotidyltransferase with HDIG domain
MNSDIILKKLNRIDELPTLPTIALEVNKMLQDYETSISRLTQLIEKDQSIASKILKLSNSTFYGSGRKINNISNAAVMIGFNTIRNIVVSISVIKAFTSPKNLAGFDISDFWKHSVAVAMVSKELGEQFGYPQPDDCFLAGLLHDVGKLVLSQFFQDHFKKIWTTARDVNISFYQAEKNGMSIDHADIGGYLAKRWQLPAELVDTIQYHHTMNESAINHKLLTIVYTANILVNTYKNNTAGKSILHSLHPDAIALLKPQIESSPEWFPQMSEDIEAACNFFIEKRDK